MAVGEVAQILLESLALAMLSMWILVVAWVIGG